MIVVVGVAPKWPPATVVGQRTKAYTTALKSVPILK